MPALLCLDLGTSSAKAAVIAQDGRTLATAHAPYPTRHLPGGGAEQDPADWVAAARTAIDAVLADAPVLAALALTGQMQDLVLEGEHGAAHPAILYSDQRAGAEVARIRAGLAAEGTDWDRLAGNLQDASSCAAMALRLARTAPEALARTRALTFGPAGHLAYLLGVGAVCDPTTAATTGLLDLRTRTWSEPVARAAGIDPALLPRVTGDVGEIVGRTDARARSLLGLPADLPIVLAPGDAGAGALGITGSRPGRDHTSLGTSGWIAGIRPAPSADGDVARGAHPDRPQDPAADDSSGPCADPRTHGASHRLALGADTELRISAVLAAGAAAAWARSAYLGGAGAEEADALLVERARECGRGPTRLLVLPSLGGERFPVRDEALRGAVLGIDAATRPIDLYAATLEGVALALSHALEPAPADPRHRSAAGQGEPLPVVGGGAASAPWRQILADVVGRPVIWVDGADATLRGAALAAADALGLDHTITPLADHGGEITPPDPDAAAAYAALRPRHRRLYETVAAALPR